MRILKLLMFGLATAFLTALSSSGLARNTGLIFVSSERTDSLLIVDPETSRIVKYLKTSRRPRDMHFNTDHTYLYIACADDDAIDIIDVAKLEVVGRLPTASSPWAAIANQFRSLGILRSLTRPEFSPGSERASSTTAARACDSARSGSCVPSGATGHA
jgi:hypothetical protein